MLELLFALLLQLATLQNGGQKPATDDKAASGKPTITTNGTKPSSTGTLEPSIGSGGWDDKN